ncbi:MAG: FISUMP domain-containing protein [Patescibacteria group bacterium]
MKKNYKAFTLIELLVVIAIIGILATLAVVALQQARQNARDAKRVADVKQVSTALELYFNDNQAYPETLDELQVGGYMQQLPEAPSSADGTCSPEDNAYNYTVDSERGYYQLSFCTGKQVSDMSPGVLCMTPGGISINCGEESSFLSCSEYGVGDGECEYGGQIYQIVQIGSQTWFAENLNYDNGCNSVTWVNGSDEGWCGYYEDNIDNVNYGLLYQWSAIEGICPDGWHVPTATNLGDLISYASLPENSEYWCNGSSSKIGKSFAATSTWSSSSNVCAVGNNQSLNNLTGFNALPGGHREASGPFSNFNNAANFWSSSFVDSSAYFRHLSNAWSGFEVYLFNFDYAFSVRCIKD